MKKNLNKKVIIASLPVVGVAYNYVDAHVNSKAAKTANNVAILGYGYLFNWAVTDTVLDLVDKAEMKVKAIKNKKKVEEQPEPEEVITEDDFDEEDDDAFQISNHESRRYMHSLTNFLENDMITSLLDSVEEKNGTENGDLVFDDITEIKNLIDDYLAYYNEVYDVSLGDYDIDVMTHRIEIGSDYKCHCTRETLEDILKDIYADGVEA